MAALILLLIRARRRGVLQELAVWSVLVAWAAAYAVAVWVVR